MKASAKFKRGLARIRQRVRRAAVVEPVGSSRMPKKDIVRFYSVVNLDESNTVVNLDEYNTVVNLD